MQLVFLTLSIWTQLERWKKWCPSILNQVLAIPCPKYNYNALRWTRPKVRKMNRTLMNPAKVPMQTWNCLPVYPYISPLTYQSSFPLTESLLSPGKTIPSVITGHYGKLGMTLTCDSIRHNNMHLSKKIFRILRNHDALLYCCWISHWWKIYFSAFIYVILMNASIT